MQRTLLGVVVLVLACTSANAALVSRSGGSAYYDTATDLTWVADASLAATNAFGVTGIDANGRMSWDKANEWIAGMNTGGYLGTNDWRMPAVIDTDGIDPDELGDDGCDGPDFFGTDCGYNVDLATGEMARMFYGTLGNTAAYDTNGDPLDCEMSGPPFCLVNSGPFSNLQILVDYWYGTELASDTGGAWIINFTDGRQDVSDKNFRPYQVWAVRTGDIAVVPAPAAVWLLGTGLAGLVGRRWLRRKISS